MHTHNAHISKIRTLTLNMDNIPHNARIRLAITDLESQSRITYTATVKEYKVNRTTLSRRHKSETGTREDATFNSRKALIDLQEKALADRINTLSAQGIPPTPQIVEFSRRSRRSNALWEFRVRQLKWRGVMVHEQLQLCHDQESRQSVDDIEIGTNLLNL